ncbi:MAG: hypothetical protein CLLPBCKN_005617 [Chroococcidiopsis cubana SAG 39.79]|jgi:hypothetical protein|uniref:DUF937 domain-containing protein n=1 Tax=Chroococcidiopsis cubana SAG 39.79 TaxID=388085 RepID=A0AB37UPQ4_9CYAN|nr:MULTISPECIES: DUF937 domain-containing protein [Chroococcidiopsis]MDZ4876197.1 hypothetical protein [Chroococcidiopsis cubana SAG 39.79]PSB63774.1 hypothetical protein C7B79_12495 [Chroococcidiopsis cubana CCALA 043]PSM50275.1 hypothetical protein C7Y66_05125 [Chroococcidiopsis sp. CCALA 051]RUT13413.1 hypothetical protein DSM107010_13680 [Chroococcidiopsis cubana SAG 39.79]URD49454.1 DUF937 domain-containing protein [Chroococcidiopsis sp. CCNUC1]
MGLFDQIVSAVGNSNQAGSAGQIGAIVNTIQQLSNNTGADPSTLQSVLSLVGGQVRSSLQQQRAVNGEAQAQAIVNQYSGTQPSPQAVNTLFSSNQQQQLIQQIAQMTGLNLGSIQQMLPVLVPLVLNLLQSGTQTQNPQGGANPVLNAFLDADRDGDVDVADAMQMASRYLSR